MRFSRSAKSCWRPRSIRVCSSSTDKEFLAANSAIGTGTFKNILAFEVAATADIEIAAEHLGVSFSENGLDLVGSPDKELALFTFAIGILRGIEPTLRVRHFTDDVVENLLNDPSIQRISGLLKRVEVNAAEQRIVVEHFLKMRHQPMVVDGVAMKSSPQLIVNAPECHLLQAQFRKVQGGLKAGSVVVPQAKCQVHRAGKLGCAAEAAVSEIKTLRQVAESQA